MARKQEQKSTGKAKTATTTKETRRVTSLEAKDGKALSSLEEAVVRMHHGVSVKKEAQLPTNGVTDELMAQMFEMEVRAHVESGRIDDLPDVPAGKKKPAAATQNARTAKVVSELKKKK
jgi:hypothetical protein